MSQKAPPPTGRSVTTTCLTACARTHACTHADDGNLHLQLNLPRCHPYVHPEIVANPIIEQVAGAVLHGLVYIRYVNGNTACPGATVQGLHVDTQGDWGMKLAVNFSVDDITPENGATSRSRNAVSCGFPACLSWLDYPLGAQLTLGALLR